MSESERKKDDYQYSWLDRSDNKGSSSNFGYRDRNNRNSHRSKDERSSRENSLDNSLNSRIRNDSRRSSDKEKYLTDQPSAHRSDRSQRHNRSDISLQSSNRQNRKSRDRSKSPLPLRRSGPLPDQGELFEKELLRQPQSKQYNSAPGYYKPPPPRQSASSKETEQLEKTWLKGEDDFILKQMKSGALIRINDNRAKPVDWMVVSLKLLEPNALSDTEFVDLLLDNGGGDGVKREESDINEFDTPNPVTIIDDLNEEQTNELISDIQEYKKLDSKTPLNNDFWDSVLVLCEQHILKLKRVIVDGGDNRVVEVVASDIDNLLSGKSYDELVGLENRVKLMLLSNDSSIDRDFWFQLSKKLKIDKAKARLENICNQVINVRISLLKKVQIIEALRTKMRLEKLMEEGSRTDSATGLYSEMDIGNTIDITEFQADLLKEQDKVRTRRFIPMKYVSPKQSNKDNSDPSTYGRQHLLPLKDADLMMMSGLRENEELFNDEDDRIPFDSRLTKPRYYNRVMTGYEWNRYNQTHYTAENPPPKAVQGYQFNIFYPLLADSPKQIPTYKIIYDQKDGNNDTVILVFKAPPPYRDIAFRIVNQQWDRSSHRNAAYRSKFENGVLQLHFRFKKVYYRK